MDNFQMNGWLLIDKPEGISSAQALNVLKKLFSAAGNKEDKIGHAGTLDPFASGLLMVAIGEATKTINFAMDKIKTYQFTIKWGENRDTIDPEGKVTATSPVIPTLKKIEEILPFFQGEIEQTPPKFSAIKVDGERAYNLARKGENFELKPRKVLIQRLEIISHHENTTAFEAVVGKGFYIRSLAQDIASKLKACGYVCALRRTGIKKFLVGNAISLDKIQNLVHNDDPNSSLLCLQKDYLQPIEFVLDDILVQEVGEIDANKLKTGQSISLKRQFQAGELVAAFNNKLIAICVAENNQLKPKRVFNL